MFLTEKQTEEVRKYLASMPRHKLLIVKDDRIAPKSTTDLGSWLAEWIASEDRNDENFLFRLHKEIEHIMQLSEIVTASMGTYRAVKNIGILFEPAVGMSPLQFIKKYSKDCLLVLFWNGVLKNNCLYLPDEASNCIIDLSEINYLSI